MDTRIDRLVRELADVWKPRRPQRRGRDYRCPCGRAVFFGNARCPGCGAELGYEPGRDDLCALQRAAAPAAAAAPQPSAALWCIAGADTPAQQYRRCANFDLPAACNWLVAAADSHALCRACRLNRTIPDLADADNRQWWARIEAAKRRMVSDLIKLRLPLASRLDEDPARGLMFDFLRAPPGGPRVITGHAAGLITLDVEEADDAIRERNRTALREPYRTLLGHFRHEVGHYYWARLVDGSALHPAYRALFGDERASYSAALQRYYASGAPPDWADRCISAYATSHPWEDWAETWAHYLHMIDSLDTALGFGVDAANIEAEIVAFGRDALYAADDVEAGGFLALLNAWAELTTVLNELSRSMGEIDFYPFVVSPAVARKLQFVHLVVRAGAGR